MDNPFMVAGLRTFNAWWDELILELIKPTAMLSMAMGTVAVFNLSGLAIQPWYVLAWAIVQAASIDCTFFAVWDRVFTRAVGRWQLVLVGAFLALVAIAINTILAFQVLWDIPDSGAALARLAIPSGGFTFARAILAVLVFIMIAYVRSRTEPAGSVRQTKNETREPHIEPVAPASVTRADPVKQPGETVEPSGETVEPNIIQLFHQEETVVQPQQPTNETAKQRAERTMKHHPDLNATELAKRAEITPQYASRILKQKQA